MMISINSKEREVAQAITVEQLRMELGLPSAGLAIAVNGRLVPASEHSSRILQSMDKVLLISAAYGG